MTSEFPAVPANGAPATEEELSSLAVIAAGGARGYTLEVLRRNRRIALPMLEIIGKDADAREKWIEMGLPGALPRRPQLRWRLEPYEDLTGIDETTDDDGETLIVFATRWGKAGTAPQSQTARLNVVRDTLRAAGSLSLVRGVNLWESSGDSPESPSVAWGEGTTPRGDRYLVRVGAMAPRPDGYQGTAVIIPPVPELPPRVAEFDEARDLERVTLAVFRAAADRRDDARAALSALQCREEFTHSDAYPDGVPLLLEDECELPAGHSGDHASTVSSVEDEPKYRAAVTAHLAATESAAVAREAWEDAQEVLDALSCGHVPTDRSGWPCVERRGHGEGVAHVYPTTMQLVY